MNEFKTCNKCSSFDGNLLAKKLREIDDSAKVIVACQSMCAIGAKKPFVIVNGIPVIADTIDEVVEKVASAVESLSQRLGLPQRLRDIGIPEELLPTLAKQAFEDICTSGNIRKVTVEDLTQIYRNAY